VVERIGRLQLIKREIAKEGDFHQQATRAQSAGGQEETGPAATIFTTERTFSKDRKDFAGERGARRKPVEGEQTSEREKQYSRGGECGASLQRLY